MFDGLKSKQQTWKQFSGLHYKQSFYSKMTTYSVLKLSPRFKDYLYTNDLSPGLWVSTQINANVLQYLQLCLIVRGLSIGLRYDLIPQNIPFSSCSFGFIVKLIQFVWIIVEEKTGVLLIKTMGRSLKYKEIQLVILIINLLDLYCLNCDT